MTNPLDQFRLDGKVALVTGASSGLGERFARTLHAVGATVVITARRAERLDALAAELPGTITIAGDVSVAADRERIVAETLERAGRVDVLVNNAGIGVVGAAERESLDDFERVMQVNVTAVWHMSKMCGQAMIAQGCGSIINIASIVGIVASTPIKQANYCASKGAVLNLTRELAAQWARKGVRVNSISPGWFPSEMTAMMNDEASQKFVSAGTPLGRMAEIQEIDGALLLLASSAGSYITGHSLVVDGGWTAR